MTIHVGHSDAGMGQYDFTYTFTSDLAPNDTTQALQSGDFLTEPVSALASMSCRMESAKFEGNRSWTYGRPWSGHLAPLPHQTTDTGISLSSAPTAPSDAPVNAIVTNTWNDTLASRLFVHVALDVQAADTETTFGPQDITLTMTLSGGEKRTYHPSTIAAPTYQKLDPLGQSSTTQTAYEVDPKEDLGALGALQIAAHAKARVVATFLVGTDAIANPNDNRHVVIR